MIFLIVAFSFGTVEILKPRDITALIFLSIFFLLDFVLLCKGFIFGVTFRFLTTFPLSFFFVLESESARISLLSLSVVLALILFVFRGLFDVGVKQIV